MKPLNSPTELNETKIIAIPTSTSQPSEVDHENQIATTSFINAEQVNTNNTKTKPHQIFLHNHHHTQHGNTSGQEYYSSDSLLQYVREGNLNQVKELLILNKTAHDSTATVPASMPGTRGSSSPYSTITNKDLYLSSYKTAKLDLEICDEAKQTPLIIATRFNYYEIACLLIENEADVNKVDADQWTPLLNAAKNGNLELVSLLLERKALIEVKDCGGFTPLMWACYKNRLDVVNLLLKNGANPNAQCKNSICCLSWAAGRGYGDIVDLLLSYPYTKVNLQDLNSSSPLIWAARKGVLNIVKKLVDKKANVELIGMNNMTPLITSCKHGNIEVALYLSKITIINLNHIDKDGQSALSIAARSGYTDVVLSLLESGAYINTPNKKGDSILITAVKGAHKQIVEALLDRHVEIDAIGNQGKTAMHQAVEKGNIDLVRTLLSYKPDLEIATKDGDTLLLLATKRKSAVIVNELLNYGCKVSPTDKNGDNVLHISLRNRSREITELILSNPKNSKYLYRPNKHGDTPYKIDASNPKSILTQIFGARQLNITEDGLLGYDLYSSALAEILSEPSLNTPITVGLYAKWGSGKSFLLAQLKAEMKSFARLTRVVNLRFNFFLILTVLLVNLLLTTPFCFWKIYYGLILFGSLSVLSFIILGACIYFYYKREKDWAERACQKIAFQLNKLKLLLRILFLNPNDYKSENMEHKTLRFIFTEYGKISTIGGESAFAIMVGSLYTKMEDEFGIIITRLCRVFYNKSHSHSKFRRVCCIPTFLIIIIIFLITLGLAIFIRIKKFDVTNLNVEEQAFVVTFGFIVLVAIVGSSFTWMKIIWNLVRSPKMTIIKAAQLRDKKRYNQDAKNESFIFKLKKEIDLIAHTVRTIDIFNHSCTRLVVVIDGLDSCEQNKVIQILEIIHVLFTREGDQFINILAVDPHVLIKGIEGNLTAVFRNGNVNGHDYLRTIIHLPVYLQVDLAKAKALSKERTDNLFREKSTSSNKYSIIGSSMDMLNKLGSNDLNQNDKNNKKLKKRRRSVKPMSAYDLTDQLIKSDYFLDVNPRNLRRLINIIALTGRLLRAYHIDFSWRILASWIYLSEQWPYRCSWVIMYYDEHESEFGVETKIYDIYQRVKSQIPVNNEPLLELDRNARKFEQFLENSQPTLTASVLKKLLPCTCNLDPHLIKLIKDAKDVINENRLVFPVNASFSNFDTFNSNNSNNNNNNLFGYNYPLSRNNNLSNSNFNGFFNTTHQSNNANLNNMLMMNSNMDFNYNKLNESSSNPSFDLNNNKSPGLVSRGKAKETILEEESFKIDLTKSLNEMNVNDICDVINESIEYLSDYYKEIYTSVIKEKNVNGKVLLVCDIDELKSELQMTFGDWQLFKSWLLTQRSIQQQRSQRLKQQQILKQQLKDTPTESAKKPDIQQTEKIVKFNESSSFLESIPLSNQTTMVTGSPETPTKQEQPKQATPTIITSSNRKVEFFITPVIEVSKSPITPANTITQKSINNELKSAETSQFNSNEMTQKLNYTTSINGESQASMFLQTDSACPLLGASASVSASKTSINESGGNASHANPMKKLGKKIFKSIDNIFHKPITPASSQSKLPTIETQLTLDSDSLRMSPIDQIEAQNTSKLGIKEASSISPTPSKSQLNDDQFDYYEETSGEESIEEDEDNENQSKNKSTKHKVSSPSSRRESKLQSLTKNLFRSGKRKSKDTISTGIVGEASTTNLISDNKTENSLSAISSSKTLMSNKKYSNRTSSSSTSHHDIEKNEEKTYFIIDDEDEIF